MNSVTLLFWLFVLIVIIDIYVIFFTDIQLKNFILSESFILLIGASFLRFYYSVGVLTDFENLDSTLYLLLFWGILFLGVYLIWWFISNLIN
jgi:hypothetical protein